LVVRTPLQAEALEVRSRGVGCSPDSLSLDHWRTVNQQVHSLLVGPASRFSGHAPRYTLFAPISSLGFKSARTPGGIDSDHAALTNCGVERNIRREAAMQTASPGVP
jgi:hypothetical protein